MGAGRFRAAYARSAARSRHAELALTARPRVVAPGERVAPGARCMPRGCVGEHARARRGAAARAVRRGERGWSSARRSRRLGAGRSGRTSVADHLHRAARTLGSVRGCGESGSREPRANPLYRVGAVRHPHGRDRAGRRGFGGGGGGARRVPLLTGGRLLLGIPARPHGAGGIVAQLNALSQLVPLASTSGLVVILSTVTGAILLMLAL